MLDDRTRESTCLVKLHHADCIQDCYRPLKPQNRCTPAEDGGAFDARTRKSACIADPRKSDCLAGFPSDCLEPYSGSESAALTDAIPCGTCLRFVANNEIQGMRIKWRTKKKECGGNGASKGTLAGLGIHKATGMAGTQQIISRHQKSSADEVVHETETQINYISTISEQLASKIHGSAQAL